MVIGPPEGDAAQIVRNCGMGHAFDYEDADGPADWIEWLAGNSGERKKEMRALTGKPVIQPDKQEISRYARPELTRRLAGLLTAPERTRTTP